ncbi:hypothetical protein C8R45DRAFT_1010444 [Mycena sanguinolenta]|nr:hypothetical protein C8R45DRAFT_1010444 [Mycena sanguinolenta]
MSLRIGLLVLAGGLSVRPHLFKEAVSGWRRLFTRRMSSFTACVDFFGWQATGKRFTTLSRHVSGARAAHARMGSCHLGNIVVLSRRFGRVLVAHAQPMPTYHSAHSDLRSRAFYLHARWQIAITTSASAAPYRRQNPRRDASR